MESGAIQIALSNTTDKRLADLTLKLSRDLDRSGVSVIKSYGKISDTNTRGDAVTLGQIAVTFLTSGAAIALFECVKAYITRENNLKITITKADGSKVEIDAKNVDDPETKEIVRSAVAKTSGAT
jgi:hypothetical protein